MLPLFFYKMDGITGCSLRLGILSSLLFLSSLKEVQSHVVLTFPQARKYDIDFLQNSTYPEPCGMPKGPVRTTLQSGKPFNVTWRLAYPHRGGYRLQLLDSLSRPVLDLTPVTADSEFVTFDSKTDFLTVSIPTDFECENCTIRLVREAKEWPERRWFYSCADVDVKTKKTYRENCSGHGRYLLSKCRCDRFYYGENCQYKDECIEHIDCGDMGRCVDLETNSPPRKQCYCELGWYGPGCTKRSVIKSTSLDLSGHMHKELSSDLQLYWRLMAEEGELEVVMVGKGTNYIALGWRPNSTSADCLHIFSKNNTNNETMDESDATLHPMDCTDMVIGMARNSSFRIWDYYSKDRSTPHLDTYWGGKNDLTAAMGFEKDGMTTILFRKKIKATEPTDHAIINEDMHVIWARGQDQGSYEHWPESGFVNNSEINNFYQDDELKYHGYNDHRGITTINFYDQRLPGKVSVGNETQLTITHSCRGNWRHPKNCNPAKEGCEYHAQWLYSSHKDLIHFTISTKNTDLWTGIAFSNDHKMAQTDAIIGLVDKAGRAFVMDTWIVGRTSPFLDSSQDVSNITARTVNGITTLSFARKRTTGDTRDLAFTDDECLYMMFPVKGGEFNAVNKKIRQHQITPSISASRVCIKACAAGEEELFIKAKQKIYQVEIKLANLGKDFKAPLQGTVEFESLSESLTAAFRKLLIRFEKSMSLEIKEFTQNGNEILTRMEIHLEDFSLETPIKQAIENAVTRGRVGTILLEPGYMTYTQIQERNSNEEDGEPRRNSVLASIFESWIVLGCLIALLILIIMQAWCTICTKGRSSKYDQKNMPWKDYSSNGINYEIDHIDSGEKLPGTLRTVYQPSQQKMPPMPYIQHNQKMSHPTGNNNFNDSKSLQRPKGGHMYPMDRSTHSLPRAPPQIDMQNGNYYTHRPTKPTKNGKDQVQPDFYFMPSQRKYSGEVVRVYVDYDNQNK